ncbi:MAG: metalloregulator ArsR/SmtB family transcription factor [Alphaproteobacteria bacterium]
MKIDETSAARSLSALGHEARLRVFRLLVRAGADGLNVGEIGSHVALPASTLAHHLSTLVQAGLVLQERQGREIINRADYAATTALVAFLTDECCIGVTLTGDAAA